ncbi:DEAD/DEAH box helicase [Pseudofrankia sp. BMG5.37]|uniref:DEAD/DEAH box helicase n=1 Tax=Pseudofrankia sp. BMG5.37 TaxID=3050035 RepID=UPI0028948BDE|nr:DEAD/DEAH box helicase [Pseudofrankia sp. BMG5.37]MDT3444488.1 DEAD/DEAH box helicase [Pseudofrankia sp. BMG5.37]
MSVPAGAAASHVWAVADGLEFGSAAEPGQPADVEATAGFPPGSQVLVRDELWLVRKVTATPRDGWRLEVTGVSSFVRGLEAVFYESLDDIQVLDPRETVLVADDSANHRRARLFLEAVIRKTFLPQTEHGLALADGFLMNRQTYQLRPAEIALSMRNPQPRLLVADAVGLGKTLEIGVLLAELVRRGRGERILVVTPKSVLEQFQRELWTRFGLPLVRLDSTGVRRVEKEIPAGRNPFGYFKRVIISVDTLKDPGYAPHLENTDWDAVVIDESHNLINRGTQNNDLARLLAGRTDALVLASATPHNGDARSFAELIRLLDEAAIANPAEYDVEDLQHLYIRRTKTSPEVRDDLSDQWADRLPPVTLTLPASAAEEAVLAELRTRWLPVDPSVSSPSSMPLFPYTLLKAFLSSHHALLSTVRARLATIEGGFAQVARRRGTAAVAAPEAKTAQATTAPGELDEARKAERDALLDLRKVAEQIRDEDSAKLDGLVKRLRDLGVAPGSDVRVVVFSESVPTLNWLARTVPPMLGFVPGRLDDKEEKKRPWKAFGGAVEVWHNDANSDEEQRILVERFGLRDDPVRLLFTGDIASEGVNLHQQCHQLIHYDLPWSLIRIEQRNGRIDRYGQRHRPQIAALLLVSDRPWRPDPHDPGRLRTLDDRLVGEALLRREEQAHRIEGSAEAVTGLFKADVEEQRLIRDLVAGRTVEQSLAQSKVSNVAFLANLVGQVGAVPKHPDVPRAQRLTVFPAVKPKGQEKPLTASQHYFQEALGLICRPNPEVELSLRHDEDGTIAFEPTRDLVHRLRALPQSYLSEQHILPDGPEPGRVRVTFSRELAETSLRAARESSASQWPKVSYMTDIHPVLDWVTDKVLVQVGRNQAPVLAARVDEPVFLVQGIYSNALGRPTVVEWMAVTGLRDVPRTLPLTQELLDGYGLGPQMPGRAVPLDLPGLCRLVPVAVDEAERHLRAAKTHYDWRIARALEPYRAQVDRWRNRQLDLFVAVPTGRTKTEAKIDRTAERLRTLTDSLETSGEPMLRVLAVLEPRDPRVAADGNGR